MPQLYRLFLSIAGISVQLETDRSLAKGDEFLPFLTGESNPDYRAFFRRVDRLPLIPDQILHEELCFRIHPDGRGGFLHSFFNPPGDLTPYAVAMHDYSRGIVQVDYLKKGVRFVSGMNSAFFHVSIESLLIHKNRLCLHAACVRTHLGGLLFSGPSGIGKSTQAELWCNFRGAKQINGDRPILSRGDFGWLAWGSPYAGSSRCHVNESCPVTAIVMLRQAKECGLRRLCGAEAFRAIWSELTVHSWDKRFMEIASDLALELIGTVPVFELQCTPDEQAVDYLEQGLRKECGL